MKIRQRQITIMLIVCALFGWILFGLSFVRENHLYAMATVVTHISEATDTVTVKDCNGNLWQFKGTEDWAIGDVASCVMDSRGTPSINDDVIARPPIYNGDFTEWTE